MFTNDVEKRSIYNFFKHHVPKIELHAHLNGCIRPETLMELAVERNIDFNLISKISGLFPLPVVIDNNDDKDDVAQQCSQNDNDITVCCHLSRTLQECFDLFAILPSIITDLNALRRITYEALEDFAIQNHTVYMELRSTPKRLLYQHNDNSTFSTKREYIETILDVIIEFEQKVKERYDNEMRHFHDKTNSTQSQRDGMDALSLLPRLPFKCMLIVSIDGSNTIEEAHENVDLAIEFNQMDDDSKYQNYVVGIDLCGNPMKSDFQKFQSLFETARTQCPKLKFTIHCAELKINELIKDYDVNGQQETSCNLQNKLFHEAKAMIEFQPNRLGHALLLPPSLMELLRQYKIPVETCPTSNIMTTTMIVSRNETKNSIDDNASIRESESNIVERLRNQHESLQEWIVNDHPIIICTDDPGIFNTTITDELCLVFFAFFYKEESKNNDIYHSYSSTVSSTSMKLDSEEIDESLLASHSLELQDFIYRFVSRSIAYTFCDDIMKSNLQKDIDQRLTTIFELLGWTRKT